MKEIKILFILLNCCLLVCCQSCSNENDESIFQLPTSCYGLLERFPTTPNGYYVIRSDDDKPVTVFCDMTTEHCGSKGWMRVAHVDMTNKYSTCPGNFTLVSGPIRSCQNPQKYDYECSSAIFSTYGKKYSQVCGRVRGYQVGYPGAFGPYINDQTHVDHIMEGLLISEGEGRKHIWAYAVAYARKLIGQNSNTVCPCSDYRYTGTVASFIGNDYYCDSGTDVESTSGKFYTDPLFTGKGCTPPNFCCSQSGLPWFCKQLPVATSDYLEIRSCHNSLGEDFAMEQVELYIR